MRLIVFLFPNLQCTLLNPQNGPLKLFNLLLGKFLQQAQIQSIQNKQHLFIKFLFLPLPFSRQFADQIEQIYAKVELLFLFLVLMVLVQQ